MESKNLPPPPGVIGALVNGFETVANHLGVLLLPVLFDVFLWLGPQLKARVLITPLLDLAAQIPDSAQAQAFSESLAEFANGFNLFSVLRSYPFGVYSLMTANLSLHTPLGERLQLDPGNLWISLLLIVLLTGVGWLGGGLYYYVVAGAIFKQNAPSIWRSLFHFLLLCGFWMVFWVLLNVPLLIFLGVLGMLNPVLRIIILVLLSLPFAWFLLGMFYSAHGIYVGRHNAFRSLWNSFRMVRYGLPNIGWFSLMAIVLSQGLDMLWRIPPAESWMTLVGILGHAFVSTSLLAASFYYYRDVNLWIESALQWLKMNSPSSARA
ncbi:MAG: hypothetical protein DDG60_11780 [Anaerolineae bacterium]|nr:MAG: hypothetical protein DDG60_11780 [Anaerolineae bacterium]